MSVAFVDTSVLVAICSQEPGFLAVDARLARFDAIYCSDLLVAELRSVCKRDASPIDVELLDTLKVSCAPRSLHDEMIRVLDAGYVRGADCFHLATALYLAPDPTTMTFLTLDKRQRDVAIALGFAV